LNKLFVHFVGYEQIVIELWCIKWRWNTSSDR